MSYFAQHNEDLILHEHYGAKTGFFVEVGASNGVDLSNTCFFERSGWSGVLVEANPDTAALCRTNRPGSHVFNCAVVGPSNVGVASFTIVEGNTDYSGLRVSEQLVSNVGRWTGNGETRNVQVEARTLDSILSEVNPTSIDFITVDVEGHEWGVLQGFSIAKWAPDFIILERNETLPDPRIMRYLHANGYRYLRTTGVNDWFHSPALSRVSSVQYWAWIWSTYYAPKYLRAFGQAMRSLASSVKRRLLGSAARSSQPKQSS